MSINRCCLCFCNYIALIISIAFGIITGILFFFGILENIMTAIWIVFALAVLTLILFVVGIFIAAAGSQNVLSVCMCRTAGFLLAGVIGTIFVSVVALAVSFFLPFIVYVGIVAAEAFFFALMLCGLVCLISCIKSKLCCRASE